MKWIILFPFLPFKWAWKWSAATEINGHQNIIAHIVGFLIVAGLLYSAIGWGVMKVLSMCGVNM